MYTNSVVCVEIVRWDEKSVILLVFSGTMLLILKRGSRSYIIRRGDKEMGEAYCHGELTTPTN